MQNDQHAQRDHTNKVVLRSFRLRARVGTCVHRATCCCNAMAVSPFAMTRGDAIETMDSKSVQEEAMTCRV